MDAVSKSEICKSISQQLGYRTGDVAEVLKALGEHVEGALLQGKDVRLGFVSIRVKEVQERNRRNPKTGEPVFCPAYQAVKAHVAPSIRAEVKAQSLPKKKKAK